MSHHPPLLFHFLWSHWDEGLWGVHCCLKLTQYDPWKIHHLFALTTLRNRQSTFPKQPTLFVLTSDHIEWISPSSRVPHKPRGPAQSALSRSLEMPFTWLKSTPLSCPTVGDRASWNTILFTEIFYQACSLPLRLCIFCYIVLTVTASEISARVVEVS